jgi:hypothetical protein
MNELFAAIRQAINDADGAASNPDDLLTLQAQAVVQAVEYLGYILPAGTEYGVVQGTVTLEVGFNTLRQAELWAESNATEYQVRRRPVGVWEDVEGTPGRQSGSPDAITNFEEKQ